MIYTLFANNREQALNETELLGPLVGYIENEDQVIYGSYPKDTPNAQITVSGQAYVDKKFDNIKRDSWYTLSVPFPVRMNTIKNADDLTAALNYGSDYIFQDLTVLQEPTTEVVG